MATDVCGVCGVARAPELKFTKIADGWVCVNCLRDSAISVEIPDFAQRSKALKGMTIEQFKEKVAHGQAVRASVAEQEAIEAEERKKLEVIQEEKWANRDKFPVTTVDIAQPYRVIGPVFFQTSNKGIFSSSYSRLAAKYRKEIMQRRADGTFSPMKLDWDLFLDPTVGQNDFDPAFFICVEELKRRAIKKGADAVVGLKVDFDLDTNGFQYFYVQAYGTAVKFID